MSNPFPGCFGAASVFSHDSLICQKCNGFTQCSEESIKTLEAIKSNINVRDLLAEHAIAKRKSSTAKIPVEGTTTELEKCDKVERKTRVATVKFGVSKDQSSIMLDLNVKSQEISVRLCERGLMDGAPAKFAKGENPFAGAQAFIEHAAELLLAGGFSRATLKEAFMQKFNWTDGTARSHINIVCPIISHFKLAEEKNGWFSLPKETEMQ